MTIQKTSSRKPSAKAATKRATTPRKTAKKSEQSIDIAAVGKWSFLVGVGLAILLGIIPPGVLNSEVTQWVVYLLMLLGLVGGVLFITKSEENSFILLAVGLAFSSSALGSVPQLGNYLAGMANALSFFLGFAVIGIVARNVVGWFTR
ncbi:MAG: hypothetical protein KIS85_04220 [Anaerolineales bacterium]|nr:hypothetical protein [Anaerolineales bacterium]